MINYKYPNPALIPTEAHELDYFRYAKKPTVSAVEASHIICGLLPTIDSSLAFLNPYLVEAHEIYKLLVDVATNGKIENLENINGTYKAPLLNWAQFLLRIGHPIPDILLVILDHELKLIKKIKKAELKDQLKKTDVRITTTNLENKQKKLYEEIIRLDKLFSKIPYQYYYYHPDISKLILPENISIDAFVNIAAKVITRSRPPGRPSNNFLEDYEKAHPEKEMQEWFKKIKSLK